MVVIHDSELLGEADDAAGSSGRELTSQLAEEVFTGGLTSGWGCAADIPSEDFRGEFTVLKNAGSILIIDTVKSVKILNANKIKINAPKKIKTSPARIFKPPATDLPSR